MPLSFRKSLITPLHLTESRKKEPKINKILISIGKFRNLIIITRASLRGLRWCEESRTSSGLRTKKCRLCMIMSLTSMDFLSRPSSCSARSPHKAWVPRIYLLSIRAKNTCWIRSLLITLKIRCKVTISSKSKKAKRSLEPSISTRNRVL